jgi:hypothetical protein
VNRHPKTQEKSKCRSSMNIRRNIEIRSDDNPNARDTLSFKFKCQVKFFTQPVNDTEAASAVAPQGNSVRREG